MTVTIGARGSKSSSESSSSTMACATSALTYSVLYPNSSATRLMVSASRRWLIDTMIPILIQVAITCVTETSIMLANSLAVTNSVIFSTLLSAISRSSCSCIRLFAISRLSLRYLEVLLLPLEVRRAKVSFTCLATSSSLTSCLMIGFLKRSLLLLLRLLLFLLPP